MVWIRGEVCVRDSINPEVLSIKVAYKPMRSMAFTQRVKASGEEKSKA